MKRSFLILIISFAVIAQPALPPQTQKPLSKEQVVALVKAGMDDTQLAKSVRERGIDFDPTDDEVEALRKAGAQEELIRALHAVKPQPLNKEQVLQLVAGGVPSQRAVELVKQRGVNFLADDSYLETLRLAGADDTLLGAVREASAAATGKLAVVTLPDAEVYLDGEFQGRADAQGELAIKARLGTHALKVSLKGQERLRAERHDSRRPSDPNQGTARGCAGKHKIANPCRRQHPPGRCEPGKRRWERGTCAD